jgi:Tfp pilus assembly protein PilF
MIILNVMGLLYYKEEDYDQARHLFKDALEKPGTSIGKAIVYNNLGILEILLGNITSEVHEYFKKSRRTDRK